MVFNNTKQELAAALDGVFLTWRDVEYDMAVCPLLHGRLVMAIPQYVQRQAAVASLAGHRQIHQCDTEEWGLGLVHVGFGGMQAFATVLLHVWVKEPHVLQMVSGILQRAGLFTQNRYIGSFRAHHVDKGHRDTERLGMEFTHRWRRKEQRETIVTVSTVALISNSFKKVFSLLTNSILGH